MRVALARVVEPNERWELLAAQLRAENAALRAENERVLAELAVLQRLVFGRSSERPRPQAPVGDDDQSGHGQDPAQRQPDDDRQQRGLGDRASRRDYSHLAAGGGALGLRRGRVLLSGCSSPFEAMGDHAFEQVDLAGDCAGGGASSSPVSASLPA